LGAAFVTAFVAGFFATETSFAERTLCSPARAAR
jgi:hypothetical protein